MFECNIPHNTMCMTYNHISSNVYREIFVKIYRNRIEFFYEKML